MIRRHAPQTANRRRGTAVVEFAVVAPILFLIILGMIEMARGYMVEHLLTNGARIGARAAIIEGTSSSGIETAVTNYLDDSGITGATVTVQVNGPAPDAVNVAE